ncbi:hypothetical protein [uncultured Pontibacter sp.]|uniref:hypothetical protein n=1 Tax=uncultured Pontibacter sp. TaxID=453356 RepID=UPI00260FC26C|nr:hypothetical protein [uncultured Pontibacter sp.]
MNKIKTGLIAVTATVLLILLVLRIISVKNAESHGVSLDRELAKENGFFAAEYTPIKTKVLIGDSLEFILGSAWIHEPIKVEHRFFIFNSYYAKSPVGELNWKYTAGNIDSGLVLTVAKNDTVLNEMFFAKNELPQLKTYSLENQLVDKEGNHFNLADYTDVDTVRLYVKKASIVPDRPISSATESEYILYKIKLHKEPVDSVLFVKRR